MTYLTDSPIDVQALIDRVMRPTDGALALFAGVVRNHHEGKSVESIFYDAYRPMAEKEIARIIAVVEREKPMVRIAVAHRLGHLTVGETSIAIACSSPHRAEAFAACRAVIDRIKQSVPIWKKEKSSSGQEWVGWQGRGMQKAESGMQQGNIHSVSSGQLPEGTGTGESTTPIIPAASTIVLRDDPFEVLLMRRVDTSSFVPGAWVFPGGMAENIDRKIAGAMGQPAELDTMKVCAIRELLEESGLWLGEPLSDHDARRLALLEDHTSFEQIAGSATLPLDRLVWTARWITPAGIPKRFDTYFFLAAVPRDRLATPDQREAVEMLWIAPSEALRRERRGELKLVFPTIKNLEAIASFRSARDLLDARRSVDVPTTRPILVVEGKERRIILPESARS